MTTEQKIVFLALKLIASIAGTLIGLIIVSTTVDFASDRLMPIHYQEVKK